ncbi:MAG: hypothetical protein JW974_02730 [Alphaproteobacteria bacterium]|nr:hypothetical protein [Alphaproteobacteria bacterium]MBN2675567.1 hypothetical protein [Alphaproteobacteria bacterium]
MIDKDSIFNELKDMLVLECPSGHDTNELINIADSVVDKNIQFISICPESVEIMWTWLEKTPTKIIARFDLDENTEFYKLSEKIKSVFKKGASGTQIAVPYSLLSSFVSELTPIRDDLFFNKILSIKLDLEEINPLDWSDVFLQIKNINADALVLDFRECIKNKKNFVGRVFGFLENLESEFNSAIHFSLGNDYEKIEQVWRLVQKMRPEISENIKFFIKK